MTNWYDVYEQIASCVKGLIETCSKNCNDCNLKDIYDQIGRLGNEKEDIFSNDCRDAFSLFINLTRRECIDRKIENRLKNLISYLTNQGCQKIQIPSGKINFCGIVRFRGEVYKRLRIINHKSGLTNCEEGKHRAGTHGELCEFFCEALDVADSDPHRHYNWSSTSKFWQTLDKLITNLGKDFYIIALVLYWARPKYYLPLPNELGNETVKKELEKMLEKIRRRKTISNEEEKTISNASDYQQYLKDFKKYLKDFKKKYQDFKEKYPNGHIHDLFCALTKPHDPLCYDKTALLKKFRQIILYGPPGTGKTYLAKQIAKHFDKKYKIVQFHPSYNYEDFVCGLVARTKNSAVVYEWKDKIFAKMCEEAEKEKKKQKKQKVLIIDEINRANLAAVLGELIYALEYRGESIELPSGEQLSVPENLYIIGTMNTADRSIGHIDYAVRRRFAFIEVLPNRGILEQFYQDKKIANLKDPALELFDSIENLFKNCLCPDYTRREVQPGHTYFMAESEEELFYKFMYQLWPLLLEYAADGVLCCRDCPPGNNQCRLGRAFREGETFSDELSELTKNLGPGKTGEDDAASEEGESQRDDV